MHSAADGGAVEVQDLRFPYTRGSRGTPGLVIADEPTSALDADRRARFLDLLFACCADAGAALVFVSHDRALASSFDRAVSLPTLNRAGEPVSARDA